VSNATAEPTRRRVFTQAANHVNSATTSLAASLRVLDGIEFSARLEEIRAELKEIEQRMRDYSANDW
jgi:hypothetical protein